jgi:hypothetical protein
MRSIDKFITVDGVKTFYLDFLNAELLFGAYWNE